MYSMPCAWTAFKPRSLTFYLLARSLNSVTANYPLLAKSRLLLLNIQDLYLPSYKFFDGVFASPALWVLYA